MDEDTRVRALFEQDETGEGSRRSKYREDGTDTEAQAAGAFFIGREHAADKVSGQIPKPGQGVSLRDDRIHNGFGRLPGVATLHKVRKGCFKLGHGFEAFELMDRPIGELPAMLQDGDVGADFLHRVGDVRAVEDRFTLAAETGNELAKDHS